MGEEQELRARLARLEAEVARLRPDAQLPYRAVVEDMSELVVRWEPDGTRVFVNDAYCRLFGQARAELVGTSFWSLISERDRARVRSRIAALCPDQPVSTGRHRATRPDGSIFWMEWVDRAIFDDAGQLRELQSVGRDITERVQSEAQARRLERADAASRVSAGIVHDLSNIVQVIATATSAVRLGVDVSSSLDLLDDATRRAGELLGRLHEVGEGLVTRAEPVELRQRVRSLRGLLEEVVDERTVLEFRLSADPCCIEGDPTQIDQVVLNLVRNAAEAMPGGGRVIVETVRAKAERDEVILRVADDGPGIPEPVRGRIFDPRITTKANGHGLGLATVKSIVEAHGGTVAVRTPGQGTVFELRFPGTDAEAGSESAERSHAGERSPHRHRM